MTETGKIATIDCQRPAFTAVLYHNNKESEGSLRIVFCEKNGEYKVIIIRNTRSDEADERWSLLNQADYQMVGRIDLTNQRLIGEISAYMDRVEAVDGDTVALLHTYILHGLNHPVEGVRSLPAETGKIFDQQENVISAWVIHELFELGRHQRYTLEAEKDSPDA